MANTGVTLGHEIATARHSAGQSLRGAATAAEISAAYLQKLESDKVDSPSPRVLRRLADVLEVPYERLMKRAGYVMPTRSVVATGTLERKLADTSLSDSEERAVAAFIDHLLDQRGRRKA